MTPRQSVAKRKRIYRIDRMARVWAEMGTMHSGKRRRGTVEAVARERNKIRSEHVKLFIISTLPSFLSFYFIFCSSSPIVIMFCQSPVCVCLCLSCTGLENCTECADLRKSKFIPIYLIYIDSVE